MIIWLDWFNGDTAIHTVTSGTPGGGVDGVFDSGVLVPNTSFSHTFTQFGTFPYFDLVHPWQTGEIVVNSAAPPLSVTAQAIGQTTILGTCGLSFPDGSSINYGALSPDQLSTEITLNMTNSGSTSALLEVHGTNWEDISSNAIMNVNRTHYNVTSSMPYSSNISLELFDKTVTNSFLPSVLLQTFWQIEAILNQAFSGDITQTMDFTVSC